MLIKFTIINKLQGLDEKKSSKNGNVIKILKKRKKETFRRPKTYITNCRTQGLNNLKNFVEISRKI